LSDRLVLEYDFSKDKVNSLSSDNVKYIKSLKNDVKIIVCAPEDRYDEYADYSANMQGIQATTNDYYTQTVSLLKKYAAYNSRIDVEFIDPYSSEFSKTSEKYGSRVSYLGDIIVVSEHSGKERVKVLTFSDVYDVTEDETYAYMGYTIKTLTGNNIETALTGAISYVVNNEDKKLFLLMGHSTEDYVSSYYIQMLKDNNYEVEVNADPILTSVPDDCSEIVIPVPTVDFSDDELLLIAEFLENGGKYGRGLTIFASAEAPYLTKLYNFLDEWGITVEEGKVYETDANLASSKNPMTFISYNEEGRACISDSNVPLVKSEKTNGCTVTAEYETSEAAVAVDKGTTGATNVDKGNGKTYATVITSEKVTSEAIDIDKEPPKSYVSVFSSKDFLQSDYNEEASISNKDIVLSVTENNCGAFKSDIKFVKKTITDESFAGSVNEKGAKTIHNIFVFIIPLIIVGFGIFVYIRRRNAK
ncbi:MAG: GldG family protein, partial [Clostridia bacterium]|nr:GldG family protein [Clostridia bacterium]